MPTLLEKTAYLDELERRHGSSPELDELRRRYALPPDEINDSKIKDEIPSGDNKLDPPSYRRIYEDVLKGEQEWDSFIPPEKRAILRDVSPNYENGKAVINSAYLADQLGITIGEAYITHDQLARTILNAKTPTDAFKRIENRFKNGRLQVQIMDLGYDILTNKGDYETNLKNIEKLKSKLSLDARQDLRGFGEQVVGATAEQLPNMWEAIKASPWGAVPGGIIGALVTVGAGQLGPQAAAPEEVITVPTGVWTGIKWGGGVAAANRIRQLEAGGMYLELLEVEDENGNKIDPRIAKAAAHIVGVINGAIELAEWAVILETFGIGTKIFENASTKVSSKLFTEGTLKQVVAKYGIKYGTSLSAEVLQEISQETTNIVFGELAKEVNNQTKGTNIKHVTGRELADRYYQVTAESAKGFALLVAPGTIIKGTAETVKTVTKRTAEEGAPTPTVVKEMELVKPEEPIKTVPIEKQTEQIYIQETVPDIEEEIEFTKQERADIAQLEAEEEKEDLYEMKRLDIKKIKRGGKEIEVAGRFVIFEKATGKEVEVIKKRKQAKTRLAELNEKAQPVTPKGRPSKIFTGNMTIDKMVKETTALKAGLKKAAQAARKAFSEGKAEGIAKVKQYYRELKVVQRERLALKKRIDKAIKAIKKEPSKSVDFFYREAIGIIQQQIDPRKRTQKTLQKRQKMRQFLETATEEQKKNFPVKLIKQLEARNLGQFTVDELEGIVSEINRLEKLGKTKQKARIAIETSQRESLIKELIAGKVPKAEQVPKGIDFSREGLIEALKKGYLWTLRIPRILDWLDGKKGTFSGLWHKTFYDQVNRQTNAELVQTDRRVRSGLNKMKELDISYNELSEVDDFSELQNGLALTKEQQMGIYAALKNTLATDAVVNGNKITLKAANAIIGNLEQKFKNLADYIIEDYSDNYERLRNAHIENTNEDLGREDFYTPMVRLEKDDFVTNDEIIDQLLQRMNLKRGYTQKGFTIDRKNISPEHQKPIDIRLVSVWQSQASKQEHYIHFAKLVKDLRKILSDKRIKESIESTLGTKSWGLLDKYVSRVANPTIYKAFGGLAGLSRLARGNVAIAYLTFNLITIAKQAPSFLLYAKDAGVNAMLSSITDFVKNPRQIWDMVRSMDPQVKNAFIEREFAEFEESLKNVTDKTTLAQINRILAKVGKTGMIGIRFVDGVVRTIGWNAVYQKNLQLGLSEAEAARQAQNATLRTQPASLPKDIAQLYASDEFLNWFTMFTNQLNNIWNITTYDTFAYWSNQKYQDAALTLMAVSMNALFIWMLVNKKLPDDEDDLLDAATDQLLNMLPLVNSGAMAGKRGWGATSPPPIEAAWSMGHILSAKDKEKAAIAALEKALVLTGVPIIAIKRAGKFLETGEPIELFGKPKKKKITL